jgi:hypothetical protein
MSEVTPDWHKYLPPPYVVKGVIDSYKKIIKEDGSIQLIMVLKLSRYSHNYNMMQPIYFISSKHIAKTRGFNIGDRVVVEVYIRYIRDRGISFWFGKSVRFNYIAQKINIENKKAKALLEKKKPEMDKKIVLTQKIDAGKFLHAGWTYDALVEAGYADKVPYKKKVYNKKKK